MPGQIGLIQATEAIKLILKKGEPLIGQFLIYHSLETEFKMFPIRKNPSCPLCNGEPKIKGLAGYHEACSLEPVNQAAGLTITNGSYPVSPIQREMVLSRTAKPLRSNGLSLGGSARR